MPNNKNTTNIESTLLDNKIVELSTKLNLISQSGDGVSQEQLIDEAVSFLSSFFNTLSKPIFSPVPVLVDNKPNIDLYNKNFLDILSDLNIIFSEFENVEGVILNHFNFMVTDSNKILTGLKQVYTKLGDYILFSKDPTGDSLFFSDSFNNQSRIDFNSALLNSTQCNVDQDQGVITLPLDNKTIINITEQPVINSNSNGTPGNSLEDPTGLSADITRVNDSNPDTWFEYEKLLDVDDGIPLTLDITINLSSPQIINYIRINPNNFGTKNQVVIDTIETSLDGKSYLSIKDDVPLNGFISQDEDNVFILAPSSSKFAGQGIYSFNPRKVKYVHLIFKQFTPYVLDSRLRYAIGIRDIEISSLSYVDNGELISTNFSANTVFKKMALITNQNPVSQSDLAAINHFISVDNGSTWNQIQAEDFNSTDNSISKILNFNTIDTNSINTQNPIQAVRYKAVLQRNKAAFQNGTTQNKDTTISVMELHKIPTQTPFDITLNGKPIDGSISVLDPSFGSRGIDNKKYIVGVGTGNKIEFNLPLTNIQNDLVKSFQTDHYNLVETNPVEVRVNGELWSRGYLASSGSSEKIYELDSISGKIKFGDDINGRSVPLNGTIDLKFTTERLYISSQQSRSGKLLFPTSRDKKTLIIKGYTAPTSFSEVINKGKNINKLLHTNIVDITNFSDKNIFSNQRTFIDGFSELINFGDWSVDKTNGILYSKSNTSSINDTSVVYSYTPELILDDTDWNFDSDGNISINSNIFSSVIISESVPSATRYFNLGNLSVLQGTLSFTDAAIFRKEVPFVNGKLELSNNIKTTESIVSVPPNNNIISFPLRMPIVNDATYDVVFSNKNIFSIRVNSLGQVNSPNEYFVDLVNRTVYLYSTIVISDLGNVSYYYQNQSKQTNGLYSVNYNTGEVFTSVNTNSNSTCTYQYVNYIVAYPIARQITSDNFTFNSGILTLSEREILTRIDLNSTVGSTQSNFYQVVFDSFVDNQINVSDLEPFFTPILKDYAIKIIPEGALLF